MRPRIMTALSAIIPRPAVDPATNLPAFVTPVIDPPNVNGDQGHQGNGQNGGNGVNDVINAQHNVNGVPCGKCSRRESVHAPRSLPSLKIAAKVIALAQGGQAWGEQQTTHISTTRTDAVAAVHNKNLRLTHMRKSINPREENNRTGDEGNIN
ncbi:hypothetical protein BC829DRAFT_420669 [Chytridium lagenaria]|nr:hypothetical protein BC829DRAFT_420669 [Chytridium lagenaria]